MNVFSKIIKTFIPETSKLVRLTLSRLSVLYLVTRLDKLLRFLVFLAGGLLKAPDGLV